MIRRGFRPRVQGAPQEKPHPQLFGLFPLGDEINEPYAVGGQQKAEAVGTVVTGAWPGGYARSFAPGSNYYMINDSSSSYYADYPWTLMFYVFLSDSSAGVCLIGSANYSAYSTVFLNSSYISVYGASASVVARASVSLSAGTWYHVAISCGTTSGSWKMYLNGTPLYLSPNGGANRLGYYSVSKFLVARVDNASVRLDHIKAYKVNLSEEEVIQEMNKRVW